MIHFNRYLLLKNRNMLLFILIGKQFKNIASKKVGVNTYFF